jgi:nicotinamide riboside kinase
MGTTAGILKIAVVGAESTGKTSLCQWLARRKTACCTREYLRYWVSRNKRTPKQDEQARIVKAQLRQERMALQKASRNNSCWIFFDSAPLVTAAYSQYYFNDTSLNETALSHHQRRYSATLFCTPQGLDWVAEPGQRDSPEAQIAVHHILADRLEFLNSHPTINLAGPLDQRTELALAFLNGLHS